MKRNIIIKLSSFITPQIFPLGGDTPFCAFGYEIKYFYLTCKKMVAVTDGVYFTLFLNCLYTCVYLYLMRRNMIDLTRAFDLTKSKTRW